MPTHIVKQGEHLMRIALKYGFRNYRVIWDDPRNAQLKEDRGDPNVLLPGDTLVIPEFEEKSERRPTGQVYVFRIDRPNLQLRFVLADYSYSPVKPVDCELEIAGARYPLQTDSAGKIEQMIPASASDGVLRVAAWNLELPLKIGDLDPADESSGWTARLTMLGYLFPTPDPPDDLAIQMAIEEFQCDQKLPITGEMDDATVAKLKKIYGC